MRREFQIGELGEGLPWVIEKPYRLEAAPRTLCSHAVLSTNQDNLEYACLKYKAYEFPEGVVICENESGYMHTILCLACLEAGLKSE